MFKKKEIKIHPEIDLECRYKLQFDGCSKGNPGLAGAGAVIYEQLASVEAEIWSSRLFVGNKATNNEAEYAGLILGMKNAILLNIEELLVEGDSNLVIKQINGEYKVKAENLLPSYKEAMLLINQFKKIVFKHIYREKNKRADELSNQAILQRVKSGE